MASILFEIKNNIATITLNRPDKLNAFNGEMSLLLQEKLDACKSDEVRAVYLTGAGKGFSAGQDLSEVADTESATSFNVILSKYYNPIVTRIRKLEKPIVAAVNGVAAGAGSNIALCCDIVVAAQSASFIQAFSKIGLIPDSGGTYTLPRLVGWQRASALMMLGEKVSAADAEKFGMIYKALPDASFAKDSFAIAETLASMPTKALAYTKQMLNLSLINHFDDQLQEENICQQKAARTADFQEGVNAFIEKRKPTFTGK